MGRCRPRSRSEALRAKGILDDAEGFSPGFAFAFEGRVAASRTLRVRTEFFRVDSKSSRKARTIGASRSLRASSAADRRRRWPT
jgi:hypothetical protein